MLHIGECLQLIAGTDCGGGLPVAFSERLHLGGLHLANIDCMSSCALDISDDDVSSKHQVSI